MYVCVFFYICIYFKCLYIFILDRNLIKESWYNIIILGKRDLREGINIKDEEGFYII